ncbi:Uncharacterised protein [Mycobacterium tuberculosis]|nr:Uncharacterised protein [Mycobacterium tuberculosis]
MGGAGGAAVIGGLPGNGGAGGNAGLIAAPTTAPVAVAQGCPATRVPYQGGLAALAV